MSLSASGRGRGAYFLCALAGLGDAATGLLLVSRPELVLRLLGIPHPGGDLIFLRFVGVFVGCVGLACLYPLPGGDPLRMAAALEMTTMFRLAVALFVGASVTAGALATPWAAVGGYDLVLAVVQIGWLARGGPGRVG